MWTTLLWTLATTAAATQSDFELLVRAAAERSLPTGAVLVAISGLPALAASRAPIENVAVLPLSRRIIGRVPAKVEVTRGGRHLHFQVVLTIEQSRDVVRLTRIMRAGEIVGPRDVNQQRERDNDGTKDAWIGDATLAIGKRLRADMVIGAALSARDLERIPIVRAKDPVRVTIRSGALLASAPGEAQQAGAEGDSIRVLNLLSSKIVVGRVVDAGSVEVQP